MLSDPTILAALAASALVLASIALGLAVWSVVRINRYRATLDRLAHAKQVTPTPELVRQWKIEQKRYLPGSPKHVAYTNRLKALGIELGD